MQIGIIVEGTRGDVHPMIALSRCLVSAGHRVRFAGPPDFEDAIAADGVDFVSLGLDVRAFIDESAEALHGNVVQFTSEMLRYGRLSIDQQFDRLPEAMAGVDFIFAAGTIMSAGTIAELHGVPFRYFVYTPGIIPSIHHTPVVLPFQLRSQWLNRWLWRGVNGLMNAFARRDLSWRRAVLGLAPIEDVISHTLSPRPVVAVDRPLAPVPPDCAGDVTQIRCLHPLDGEPLPPKLESFLEQGEAPVYLGFGSMPDPDPVSTTRQLLEAIERIGCRALISKGWAGLGEGPLPDGVMAIDPVSHARLFPRCAAIVHHGGAGTTHLAARSGVPQILVPHVLDQFYFARRVLDLGIGPPALGRRRLAVPMLVDTIRATLDNELLAERAADLAQELRALGAAEPDLEALLST